MNIKAIRVFGSSMLPFLKDGYCFINTDTKFFNLRKGDIILYKFMDRFYIHRIYNIDGVKIIVSNDDDLTYHTISKDDVVGKVVSFFSGYVGYLCGRFLRFIRHIKRFLK